MWNLDLDPLWKDLPAGSRVPRIAIETGTCRGAGARALARRFERVVTIELCQRLRDEAAERLTREGFTNIEFVQGNSGERMAEVLRTLPPGEPVFFFLDAHWSGDRSVDWNASRWKGYQLDTAHLGNSRMDARVPTSTEQCPLLEELAAIVQHCEGPALVVIDDLKNIPPEGPGLRNGEFSGEDWSHLSRAAILSTVRSRLHGERELQLPARWVLALT